MLCAALRSAQAIHTGAGAHLLAPVLREVANPGSAPMMAPALL
jgi:hypothetical protein